MKHFHADFADPSDFDLVVNTAVLGVDGGSVRAPIRGAPSRALPPPADGPAALGPTDRRGAAFDAAASAPLSLSRMSMTARRPTRLSGCTPRRSPCSPPRSLARRRARARRARRRPPRRPPPPAVSGAGVVAEVNGAPILASELEQRAAEPAGAAAPGGVRDPPAGARRARSAERLLAAEAQKRGISAEELLQPEVDAQGAGPARGRGRDDLRAEQGALRRPAAGPGARAHPRGPRASGRRRSGARPTRRSCASKAKVAVRLDAPRATVAIPRRRARHRPGRRAGARSSSSRTTSARTATARRRVIDQVLARYPGKVRLVHLDFPLDGHPGAVPAARAARCAGEQGKFWEYHREPDDGARAARRRRPQGAAPRSSGSTPADVRGCLASDRHDAAIQASLEQGEGLGVTGTPAYFVNGRMLSGARPLEDFAEVIDAELAQRAERAARLRPAPSRHPAGRSFALDIRARTCYTQRLRADASAGGGEASCRLSCGPGRSRTPSSCTTSAAGAGTSSPSTRPATSRSRPPGPGRCRSTSRSSSTTCAAAGSTCRS